MNATLTALGSSLFALCWEAASELTYTVETSVDLQSWESVPAVFQGMEGPFSLVLEGTGRLFARLRFAANGDSDENGLADLWEWSHFSRLDVDPLADPDEDGRDNLREFIENTDPLDFYNGVRPRIQLSCGNHWYLQAGVLSPAAVTLVLRKPNGDPWPEAPVHFRLASGAPAFLQKEDRPAAGVETMIAYTDQLGRIGARSHRIHCRVPESAAGDDRILISAGSTAAGIDLRILPHPVPGRPRDLWEETGEDGTTIISWRGEPGGADRFILEKYLPGVGWIEVLNIDADDLPPPDPVSGRYRLELPTQAK